MCGNAKTPNRREIQGELHGVDGAAAWAER